jgi:hypothetical protein
MSRFVSRVILFKDGHIVPPEEVPSYRPSALGAPGASP